MSSTTTDYRKIERGIFGSSDFESFQKCPSVQELKDFVRKCGDSVINTKRSEVKTVSPIIERLIDMLRTMNIWIQEIPPLKQPSRFGNKAYRIWNERLCERAPQLIETVIRKDNPMLCTELAGYLEESFGNPTRIDYGTGHETTFIIFLYCLYKIGVIGDSDLQALILKVFAFYLAVCRNLQQVYWLEPAGSHGVWSLDDYQMLVFYFGAAQLHGNDSFDPKCITDRKLMKEYAPEYLYFEAIAYIQSTKSGQFYETSPLLYDISGAASWSKICGVPCGAAPSIWIDLPAQLDSFEEPCGA
ncbi:uncharacterized protein [Blastocystis hominis]|uniref:Serine/threonine-protein phosphatase 2A activator n=1 Tax=Blastocystis hominis TaxID=12968 RepID=D8LVH4_BLAHO|nr:uncharacterized protein [Blastocystis hominis]CBK19813.2 unnamed protein product [Blastocystis hominis]|eukprot:XP_012893861.1 uncharacterized protein [Blastocystis hominis]